MPPVEVEDEMTEPTAVDSASMADIVAAFVAERGNDETNTKGDA